MSYSIHWFRRDLRVVGNPALQTAFKESSGKVLGLFCFDQKFLSRPDFSSRRFQFFLETLKDLRDDLRTRGGDLLVMDVGPDEAFERLFAELKSQGLELPKWVTFNRDYEPFARQRDERMASFFQSYGISVNTERDHLLIEPTEIKPYQVFSPYRRKWLEHFKSKEVNARVEAQRVALSLHEKEIKETKTNAPKSAFKSTWSELFKDRKPEFLKADLLVEYLKENAKRVDIPIPQAGFKAALEALKLFEPKIGRYESARDIPSVEGTSRLSHFFKNGSITGSQVIAYLGLQHDLESKYFSELIWREFYYSVLFHFPRVENEAFLEKYKGIQWENREDLFEAWKAGKTGYPIVDAGMRELKATGFMHNRVRMIVASFLTKDLLIDWKWGERYFMEMLLDGDLAPNNGGWQWAASTGVDPQPYFRIFNPILQGQRFDPEGVYVKRWLPELKDAPVKKIHEPVNPVVVHKERTVRALMLYR